MSSGRNRPPKIITPNVFSSRSIPAASNLAPLGPLDLFLGLVRNPSRDDQSSSPRQEESVGNKASRSNAETGLAPVPPLGVISAPLSAQFHSPSDRATTGVCLAVTAQSSYLILLLVRRRIHCGSGRFCFCALASFCFVRKDLWLWRGRRQSQFHGFIGAMAGLMLGEMEGNCIRRRRHVSLLAMRPCGAHLPAF